MKRDLLIYRIITALFTIFMMIGVVNYFAQTELIKGFWVALGFPTYLVIPLAIAKIVGLVTIWTNWSRIAREWAYAGFFFNLLLAMVAHLAISDGEHMGAVMGMVLMFLSRYWLYRVEKQAS
ncbi:DoxX family protein [Sanyastnella coralliicola]|uniref:DoxX family protein n=1 Tax=Sanyastnella coralliicola TaxID=3069118 RepID=UPI0027B9397E|nr:DoxX family protein [Longitalea sp. SCSIO 12813]